MPKLQRFALIALVALLLAGAAFAWHHSRPLQEPIAAQEQFGQALRQARNGEAGAARVLYQQLARDDLSVAQRTALYRLLHNYPSPRALKLARNDLHDESPQVRQAAINAVVGLVSGAQRSLVFGPLLEDPDPSLRFAAATAMLGLAPDDIGLYFGPLESTLDAYRSVLTADGNELAQQILLGRILLAEAKYDQALTELAKAQAMAPDNVEIIGLRVRALEQQGKADSGRELLAEQLKQFPLSAPLQEELGQWLARRDQNEYALLALTRAVELAPDNNDYRYNLALTLHKLDQVAAAQQQLQDILQRHPENRQARVLLIAYWKETGQLQNVQILLAQLEQQNPDDPALQQGL
jgi:predicted Zn-dependent protease